MKPTTTPRWKIPALAWIPITLAVSAEATSNALRAYGLGSHLEQFTVDLLDTPVSIAGSVLVLAAIAVSLSQTRAAWVALTPGDTRQRVVSGIAACLLLAISISAMASHILEAQRAKTGDEGTSRAAYDRANQAYTAALADYTAVKSASTVASVKAAMDATPIDPKIRARTHGCSDVTTRASQDECEPVTRQRPALAAAERKAEIEGKLPALKSALDALKRPEAQAAAEQRVSGLWAWIMGIGVVMIATFGPAIFATVDAGLEADVDQSRVAALVAAPEDTFSRLKSQALANVSFSPLASMFAGELPDRLPENDPTPPRKRHKPTRLPENVIDFRAHPVVTALKNNGGSVSSNRELARLMNVTDGESSKRCQEIEGQLDIHRVGKELRIALRR